MPVILPARARVRVRAMVRVRAKARVRVSVLLTCDLAGELRPARLKHGEEQVALELREG